MPPSLFKDLGKSSKDLLNKGYPSNLEVTVESQLHGTDTVKGNQTTKVTRDSEGQLHGSHNPKWTLASSGVTLSATVYTSKKLDFEASVKDKGIQGLKSTLKVNAKSFDQLGAQKDAQNVSAEFEYLHDRVALAVAVDLLAAKPQVALGVTGKHEQWSAGIEAKYSIGAATDLAALATALHYAGSNWAATVIRTAADGVRANVAYAGRVHHKVDDALQLAAELKWAAADEGSDKNDAPVITVGGKFSAPRSDFKAKATTAGRLGFAYTQDLNYFTSVTLGLDLNAADASEHRLGLTLKVHD